MLTKLLKYDLKNILKFISVFYSLAIIFAALSRFFAIWDSSMVWLVISKIFAGASISMIFSILINCMMRSWVRFKMNVYGDESYLTHTLPVKKETVYLSKLLCVTITLAISFVISLLTLFITYYTKESFEMLKAFISAAMPLKDGISSTLFIITLVFILFLELLNAIQFGFTGLIIGHRSNKNKIVSSVLTGLATYSAGQVAILAIIFVIALFHKEIMNLFVTTQAVSFGTVKLIVLISAILYALLIVVNCIINVKLLKRGVNVE